jgi:deoxyribodipyrimidine photo-lyase
LIVRQGIRTRGDPERRAELEVDAVYANRDYDRSALERDTAVEQALAQRGIAFRTFKDQVIFERDEILTRQGRRSACSRRTSEPGLPR